MERRGPVLTTATRVPALDSRDIDEVVRAALGDRTAKVAHRLPPDAIGDDAALREIASKLPDSWWRTTAGDVPPVTADCAAELAKALPADTDRAVVTRLYHVQHLPAISPVIHAAYDQLEDVWPAAEPWLARDAGVFVTSAGAVTSSHADRHHNLLLQLSGSKEIAVAEPGSRAHAAIVAGSTPGMRCGGMPPGTKTYEISAGDALYMPPFTVHWVRSTDYAVALSLGWSSAATVRAGEVHTANGILQRRLHVPASPVGSRSDSARVHAVAGASRLRSALRRG